jgi:glycosyltransferase involved in cell wall biosynthesis
MRAQALLGSRRRWRTVFHIQLLRTGNELRSYLRERIDSRLVNRSGGVVLGCSRGICEHMTENLEIDPERVSYFPNWIDPMRFSPDSSAKRAPAYPSAKTDVPTICNVAGFRPVKQQDLLVRAIARLRAEGLELRVLMVGTADRSLNERYFRECQELVVRLGLEDRVHFLGSRQDVPDLLRQSDAFVFPSRQEGLACALLEAMASSMPCVAAAIHSSCEAIVHGKNGFLCSPRSELDLVATVRHVFSLPADELRRIGDAARRTVRERYTWEAAFNGVDPFLKRHGIYV